MKTETITIIVNFGILVVNILFSVNYKKHILAKIKFPKWEYFKEGIRFFNKNNDVVIEHDKPLRK